MKRRQAEVYVFALLAHQHGATLDPLDVAQWEFFVVPTVTLDRRERSQPPDCDQGLRVGSSLPM